MTPERARLNDTLARILDALGLDALDEQREQLIDLVLMLKRWNATYNLTAVRDLDAMLIQHVADCLAVIHPLDRWFERRAGSTILDVGSGAGFPGTVFAVMRPALRVTCIDSVGKKAAFIRQVAGELRLPHLTAEHGRVQELKGVSFDVITSRALSDLPLFVQLTRHLLLPQGCWMAMKGKTPEHEMQTLPSLGVTFHVEQLTVPLLDAERCLVWMQVVDKPVPASPISKI